MTTPPTGTGAASTGTPSQSRRRRPLLVAAAMGAVVAITVPLAWYLTRPEASAGLTLAEVRAGQTAAESESGSGAEEAGAAGTGAADAADTGAAPEPSPSTSATTRAAPAIGVRDASPENNRAEELPEPNRLRIPSLDIDAAVGAVGVEPDGSMVIPREVARVGWYEYGPAPGAERGNAVLAGHVDTIAQGPGALFRMREIEPGAIVEVTDEAGTVHRYEVQGKEAIVKTDLPVDDIFARGGPHVLVLVTCGGPYLPDSRRYSENLVVTAVPVDAP